MKIDGEYLFQKSTDELKEGLKEPEPITYSQNGHRTLTARKFLKRAESVAKMIGVTRVADISFLSPINFPVYQAYRPNIFGHSKMGQNTGGQGKGPTREQAKISALMETIESYCMEPKLARLIRNSREYLRMAHDPAPLNHFQLDSSLSTPDENEALMWTPAYSLTKDSEVLIPAEAVFFPFVCSSYQTEYHYAQGSNGLASGSNYLEAALHGLYELIERHYMNELSEGKAELEALVEESFKNPYFNQVKQQTNNEFELQLYSVRIKDLRNLPVIMAMLVGDEMHSIGWGCSSSIEISINRAISESIQSFATYVSGSREDIELRLSDTEAENEFTQPDYQTMTQSKLKKCVIDKSFSTLNNEFEFVVRWLKKNGFADIYFANLSRSGLPVAVVKSFVPGLTLLKRMRRPGHWTHQIVEEQKFHFKGQSAK